MHELLSRVAQLRILPVVALDRVEDTLPLGRAILEGGVDVVEITLRTPAAEEAIGILASKLPEITVGAGTVLSREQAARALDSGARFIVSPGFSAPVVDFCIDRGVPVVPGTVTPTEIQTARERGLDVIKFFPAEAAGGAKTLALYSGAFPGMMFVPTGGIDLTSLGAYMSLSCVLACGGSWMAKPERIRAGDFAGVTRLVRESLEVARASRPGRQKSEAT